MPPKIKTEDTSAADAAVVEVIDPKGVVSIPFADTVFTFKRKRIDAVQFRLQMQSNRDVAAVQWLLGSQQFAKFLSATEDEDGCTPQGVYLEFVELIGKSVGAGNS
jgi:hypothetical protein